MGNTVGSAYEGKDQTNYDGASSMVTRRPDAFLVVGPEYVNDSYSTTVIKNNNAFTTDTFILFKDGVTFKGPTDISGNTVVFQGDGVALRNNSGSLVAGHFRWTVGPNSLNRTSGTASGVTLTQNVDLVGAKVLDYTISGNTA